MTSSRIPISILALLPFLLLPELAHAADGGLEAQGAYSSNGFAGGVFVNAICDLYDLVGGSLGALLTTAAVVTAVIGAAMGGFQNAKSAVLVGISAFGISSGVSVYFGTFNCGTDSRLPRLAPSSIQSGITPASSTATDVKAGGSSTDDFFDSVDDRS
jgi:hypothetical protein